MQVPVCVFASTFQHIEPSAHESMPDAAEPSTVHGSPIGSGTASMGTQRKAFHAVPPSLAQGAHFSPPAQSSSHVVHSMGFGGPPSGSSTNAVLRPSLVLEPPSASVVDVLGGGGSSEAFEVLGEPGVEPSSEAPVVLSSDDEVASDGEVGLEQPTSRLAAQPIATVSQAIYPRRMG
jgi:hypothetical protein